MRQAFFCFNTKNKNKIRLTEWEKTTKIYKRIGDLIMADFSTCAILVPDHLSASQWLYYLSEQSRSLFKERCGAYYQYLWRSEKNDFPLIRFKSWIKNKNQILSTVYEFVVHEAIPDIRQDECSVSVSCRSMQIIDDYRDQTVFEQQVNQGGRVIHHLLGAGSLPFMARLIFGAWQACRPDNNDCVIEVRDDFLGIQNQCITLPKDTDLHNFPFNHADFTQKFLQKPTKPTPF